MPDIDYNAEYCRPRNSSGFDKCRAVLGWHNAATEKFSVAARFFTPKLLCFNGVYVII